MDWCDDHLYHSINLHFNYIRMVTSISKQLLAIGFADDQILSVVRSLVNAQKRFEQSGFNISQENVNLYFINQYKKAKELKSKDPRKAAMHALFNAKFPAIKKTTKVGHNQPCPCNSGKKYKKCCIKK